MTPFFSVIITTYNRPKKLIRAVQSVLEQTYRDFELIIVNDGSTDDYSEVVSFIEPYPLIRYFFKENEERSVARNYGVDKARGKFVCFLDDDDYYLPNHLQVLYNEIEKQNYTTGLYHTYSYKINRSKERTEMPIIPKKEQYNTLEYYVTDGIMTMNNTCGATTVFKEIPFDKNISYAEDHYQRLLALTIYPVFAIKLYTTVYDMSEDTSTNSNDINVAKAYINSWNKICKNPSINPQIRSSIQKRIINEKTKLLIQNHRNELNWTEFFSYAKTFISSFSLKEFKFIFDNIRWKIQMR